MSGNLAPQTDAEFQTMTAEIRTGSGYESPDAFALGLATVENGAVIGVQYTNTNYGENLGSAALLAAVLDQREAGLQTGEYLLTGDQISAALRGFQPYIGKPGHANVKTLMHLQEASPALLATPDSLKPDAVENARVPILGVVKNWTKAPETTADALLRLYALSERHMEPNTINLTEIFKRLPNVVMTDQAGVFTPERWNEVVERITYLGMHVTVKAVDKFPHMLDHVVPGGVRVVDSNRVRLGAYLSAGTTVMPEGAVNYNAGTLGASMIEGRLSQGVVVGEGTDIGGGASTQGTLSGGGKDVIKIGKDCLLEAESGVGISLGDDCRVEAGLYVKSTTPIKLPTGEFVRAAVVSGQDNMLLRRNSRTGEVELVAHHGNTWGGLNAVLHEN